MAANYRDFENYQRAITKTGLKGASHFVSILCEMFNVEQPFVTIYIDRAKSDD